jgi:signal transduction histidine kinase
MSLPHLLRLIVLYCLLSVGNCLPAQAQAPATVPSGTGRPLAQPVQRLADLLYAYKTHIISDTVYLRGVDSIAPSLFSDDSLARRLNTYQRIAFSDTVYGKYRIRYYRYMSLSSFTRNRYGGAIYYAEKSNEEGVRQGFYKRNELPRSALFAISVYGMNEDYARAFSEYLTLRPRLLAMPGRISAGEESADGVSVAFSILNAINVAAFEAKDSAKLDETVLLSERMLEAIRQHPEKFQAYRLFYDHIYHTAGFFRERYLKQMSRARDLLDSSIREVRAKDFQGGDQGAYTYDTYVYAFEFYFGNHQKDSAQHYLDLIRGLPMGVVEDLNIKLPFLLEGGSRLLASEGQYETAYRNLRRAYDTRDSAFYAVSSDKDNNLYALAEAENTRLELMRDQKKREEAQRFNIILFFLLILIVLIALSGYFIFRFRSKQRILQLRLGLARNFHDEIGPMLLFANTLLKKETQTRPSPGLDELKTHLAVVMDAVRGIAHDLKSHEIASVTSFGKEVSLLLEKVRNATGIDFTLRLDNDPKVLSHFQSTHLRKIMNELIGNSIKHSGCHSIHVSILIRERRLDIMYSDDGPGMDTGTSSGGIGLQNIQERTALLNGTFRLNNAYPKGYSIDIQIPLL